MFQTPAAYTRTRSIKSQLLKDDDWKDLEHAPDLTTALNILLNTTYASNFDFTSVQFNNLPSMRLVEHQLRNSYLKDAKKILRFLHNSPKKFIICFIQKYELLNLKKTIRRLRHQTATKQSLKLTDYNLGRFSLLPKTDWTEIKDFKQLDSLLEKTYYQFAFRSGYTQFNKTNDFFLFESFLEKAYFDELITKSKGLRISKLIGNYFDEICLSYFLRLRFEFNMEGPAILPLIPIKGSKLFTEKIFWEIVKFDDVEDVLNFFFKKTNCINLKEAITEIQKLRKKICKKVFIKAVPLSFSPILAYFFLKEQEIADLIKILHRKRFEM